MKIEDMNQYTLNLLDSGEEIPPAQWFNDKILMDNLNSKVIDSNPYWKDRDPTGEAFIEFAYLHVKKALEAASKGDNGLLTKEQILNSYKLSDIK